MLIVTSPGGAHGQDSADGQTFKSYPAAVRESSSRWLYRDEHTSGKAEGQAHFPGRGVPLVGDWNGDGEESHAWFSNGVWRLKKDRTFGGPPDYEFRYGSKGDIPVAGDWVHDDDSEIDMVGVVRRTDRGLKWMLETDTDDGHVASDGKANVVFYYGSATDLPVAGHWRQGVCETCPPGDLAGVVRKTGGVLTWHFETDTTVQREGRVASSDGKADITVRYGRASDRPVVGDWDADEVDNVGVVRNNLWLLDTNTRVPETGRRETSSDGSHDIRFRYGSASAHTFLTFKGHIKEGGPDSGEDSGS